MWYGKVAIITFLFSVFLLFMTVYMNQIFNDPQLTNSAAFTDLTTLTNSWHVNPSVNTALLFGDFIVVKDLVYQILTGQAFTDTWGTNGIMYQSGLGAIDSYISLLMGVLFASSGLFLILYIISNRSI